MENRYVEKLIKDYSPKEISKLDELKALDKKVKMPVKLFTYFFGVLGALVLGVGMCLAMKIIGGKETMFMVLGVVAGVLGVVMMSVNYSIYSNLLAARKSKYAEEIIARSNELLNK